MVLKWRSFLDAADQAGMSRRYGGIHFESGDRHGRAAGATIGYWTYDRAKSYWEGRARTWTDPSARRNRPAVPTSGRLRVHYRRHVRDVGGGAEGAHRGRSCSRTLLLPNSRS